MIPFPPPVSFTVTPATPAPTFRTEANPVSVLKELVANLYREQYKVQNLLSSLGFALRSFHNLNQFLELTPLMAARVTEAEGGALVLIKESKQLSLEHSYSQIQSLNRQIQEALGQGIQVLNQEPQRYSLGDLEEQIRRFLGPRLRLYSTPILVKNEERGRLYVVSDNPHYLWTPTRRKLLQLVADQTAVAIANNELTLELRAKERQDRELEIASEIQDRLLPRQCPEIEGVELAARCQTANRVGGDYYDFIPVNYDQTRQEPDAEAEKRVPWSIVIGDVMGKGVPAGLIMTMTRGMLRAEVLNRHSPAQILQHLNRVMYADLDNSHRFVTLFYSEYHPQTRRLAFSNAAHNPPLLWRSQSQTIGALDTVGALIGLECFSQYEDAQVILEPGDVVLYYTDGLTDAANSQGDRFDEANLREAYRAACLEHQDPQAILDQLFERVQKFIGSTNNHQDDMTLVVMRVKSTQSMQPSMQSQSTPSAVS
ncbi:MAG: PP2C family protein-serine/threonine phosphatase [Microcystaceae cyanobacterium]